MEAAQGNQKLVQSPVPVTGEAADAGDTPLLAQALSFSPMDTSSTKTGSHLRASPAKIKRRKSGKNGIDLAQPATTLVH